MWKISMILSLYYLSPLFSLLIKSLPESFSKYTITNKKTSPKYKYPSSQMYCKKLNPILIYKFTPTQTSTNNTISKTYQKTYNLSTSPSLISRLSKQSKIKFKRRRSRLLRRRRKKKILRRTRRILNKTKIFNRRRKILTRRKILSKIVLRRMMRNRRKQNNKINIKRIKMIEIPLRKN